MRWRESMERALYGPEGFFTRGEPSEHFRTSAQSPLFAQAIGRFVAHVDRELGHPARLDVVDVGAGGGELLSRLDQVLPDELRARVRRVAVERRPRPAQVGFEWAAEIPEGIEGLLIATEWLDNVPLDLAEDGCYLGTDEPLEPADAEWVARWWPDPAGPVEIGRSRDEAWASAVGKVRAGVALTVDYGHFSGYRPVVPTLAGFRHGREVEVRLDGSTDITCHVALDSVAASGGAGYQMIKQFEALRSLGVDGARPPIELAYRDPAAYVRALAAASEAATLTDPSGLGGHWWLVQPVGCRAWPPS